MDLKEQLDELLNSEEFEEICEEYDNVEELGNFGELEDFMNEHKDDLSSDDLVHIFKKCYPERYVDIASAQDACRTLIERKDEKAQMEVVEYFLPLLHDDDAGHRMMGTETTLDMMVEDLLPQFLPAPLVTLLEKCDARYLIYPDGDALDTLFLPAFKKTKDKALAERLLKVLEAYLVESVLEYYDTIEEFERERQTFNLKKLREESAEAGKEGLDILIKKVYSAS